ncbi:FoF1 ATP synthase subunit gamma [Methyloligella sp. 2.7D]|uniref:F0F1 ATP synthase subunit gamma n=1 Tax=unclassified Methyloligella TaxID=2625955 RepID=UPI00157D418B|nr:FoF1 ATP synthase subunit gamma [Methyloligella sp. GL2]QKP78123.1 F0F1 ATP synthase subunit gamma [Methyloligella sp. GL2]
MEQLARLKARLTTLSELDDIIVAMRAMAAAALQEGRKALPAVGRYAGFIEEGIADVAALLDATAEPASDGENGEPETLCLIGTEHGFVGDLNAELLERAEIPPGTRLVLVGRRLEGAATERKLEPAAVLSMTTHIAGVPRLARHIAEAIGPASHVRIATAKHDPGQAAAEVASRQVLPVKLPAPGTSTRPPPLHQLPPRELLAELAGEYLLAEITRALIEAMAAENQIRLGVLTAASQNIADKLDELNRKARNLRQETITTELLDVVVGAEAVLEPEGQGGR